MGVSSHGMMMCVCLFWGRRRVRLLVTEPVEVGHALFERLHLTCRGIGTSGRSGRLPRFSCVGGDGDGSGSCTCCLLSIHAPGMPCDKS